MDIKKANKIEVERSTQVGDINGIGIDAEDLQVWAYHRLVVFPLLLEACKATLEQAGISTDSPTYKKVEQAVAKAESKFSQ